MSTSGFHIGDYSARDHSSKSRTTTKQPASGLFEMSRACIEADRNDAADHDDGRAHQGNSQK
jgi:hypothetical protein